VLLGSSLFSATALGVSEVLGTYMATWFWEFPSTQIGFLAAAQIVLLLLGFSIVGPIAIGNVPVETLRNLGIVAGPGLVVFYLCGLRFVTRLRLTRKRYAEISSVLAERGSRLASSAHTEG
jgi:hypothetical protein